MQSDELSKQAAPASSEQLLRARLADVPACLREVAGLVTASPAPHGPVVVTGIGGSEGPARLMVELLRATVQARASFVPLSAFATKSMSTRGCALIVFSQGISPNAQLALARAQEFERSWLFTSARGGSLLARFEAQGGRVLTLPPRSEADTLVRLTGPAAAMLAAALHTGAARSQDVEALLSALGSAPSRVAPVPAGVPVAFVTASGYGELCRAAKNVWLEALCAPEPPMWDVLEVAHGPFQQFFDSSIALVALEREGAESALFDRLGGMLVGERHTLVRLRSALPAALAPIDHLVQVAELVCRALAASPRDLREWPGSGRDGPLYGLGMGHEGED